MHVIGTAGHVDHGKSTLVQALTGIDPDRLAEEKAREMTIDLGFAWLTLGGEEVGLVDVPGHRDFIQNMLAGIGGIDLVLLVIAADEGIMPQTREHLAILDLLQIEHGIVALTKCDLIDDPEWLELVALEISDVLRGTALAGAPIVPVSARTGQGIDPLKDTLTQVLNTIEAKSDRGQARLPIDRVFTLPGFGTIVTGTLTDGRLRVGDEVEIQPGGLAGRVRGLQTHKVKREVAYPGSRVAVNLSGVDRDDIRRGQVVARRGVLRPSRLLDVAYRHLPDADAPLAHNAEVKLFTGAAEAPAHARIIGQENIPPGQSGWVQLALAEPVAALRGDRFILRRASPAATIGGGRILDANPGRRHRRFRADVGERFRALNEDGPDELLRAALLRLGPVAPAMLIEKAGLPPAAGRPALQELIAAGQVVELGKVVIAAAAWGKLVDRLPRELAGYHQQYPLRLGMEREDLRGRLQLPVVAFNSLCEALVSNGTIVEAGAILRLPDHRVSFSPAQEEAVGRLMSFLDSRGILAPTIKECQEIIDPAILQALIDMGRVKPVNLDVVYSRELYDRLIGQLSDYLFEKGSISAAEARDLLGASRKYAIALLDHMDEQRITRRAGDVRLPARPRPTP
jgi:selenocysteine-specific elongation factor